MDEEVKKWQDFTTGSLEEKKKNLKFATGVD